MSNTPEPEKPAIAILMAVYEPNPDWLREQLESLNAQTYPNLRLYVRDDCSPTFPYGELCGMLRSCIRAFPYTVARNERNLGSNGAFERLTMEAEGELFAYCDQDDVWLPEKLSTLQAVMERENAELVCSDMQVIDGGGVLQADSITEVRRHHMFRSGEGLAPKMLVSNFVTGCTMLIRAETAREAAPFCPDMVHDHYLALFAASKGKLVSLPETLIRYRIHGGNQTGTMSGVKDKESYYRVRIEPLCRRLSWLSERFPDDKALSAELGDALRWANARAEYFRGNRRAGADVLKYRRFSPMMSLFELVMAIAPEKLFMTAITMTRKNLI